MFTLPIPRFDATVALHNELAGAAAEAERIAAAFALPESVKFQRARKLIRDALTDQASPRISMNWLHGCWIDLPTQTTISQRYDCLRSLLDTPEHIP